MKTTEEQRAELRRLSANVGGKWRVTQKRHAVDDPVVKLARYKLVTATGSERR